MKLLWLKFLLLATFVFWASGVAKYTHEMLEHHGRDASVEDDDDDDDIATTATTIALPTQSYPDQSSHPGKDSGKHPCPVCQMLAAMMVDRSAPPALPPPPADLVETLIIADRLSPTVHACFVLSARGPPAISA